MKITASAIGRLRDYIISYKTGLQVTMEGVARHRARHDLTTRSARCSRSSWMITPELGLLAISGFQKGLNRSFCPSASSTPSVHADSSIVERGKSSVVTRLRTSREIVHTLHLVLFGIIVLYERRVNDATWPFFRSGYRHDRRDIHKPSTIDNNMR